MTPTEFKAWFDGFTENIKGVPSAKQWERIKERVKEVEGDAYVWRYDIRPWWPQWYVTTAPAPLGNPAHTEITWGNGTLSASDTILATSAYHIGQVEAERESA